MTADVEEQLAAGMRDAVHGLTLTRDVLGEATRRHRRRTAVHRTAYAAGVVGLVGALAAAVAVGATGTTGSGNGHGQPAAATVDSPALRLSAALKASAETSYRLKITTTDPNVPAWTTTGAFDPATSTGYFDSPYTGPRPYYDAGFEHERLINGVRYVGVPDSRTGTLTWTQYPGTQSNLDYDGALGGALAASVDSDDLFQALRQTGATVTQTNASVYHFEVTAKDPQSGIISDAFVGDVTLGAEQRITKVTYQRTTLGNAHGAPARTNHLQVTIELSGYGAPVQVDKPAAQLAPPTLH
jgi:hypothetical protein